MIFRGLDQERIVLSLAIVLFFAFALDGFAALGNLLSLPLLQNVAITSALGRPDFFGWANQALINTVLGVPNPVIFPAGLAGAIWLLPTRTRYGRFIDLAKLKYNVI